MQGSDVVRNCFQLFVRHVFHDGTHQHLVVVGTGAITESFQLCQGIVDILATNLGITGGAMPAPFGPWQAWQAGVPSVRLPPL